MYGSTRSTQATPYLCMGQRGQHRQCHTYVWVNAVNTCNAILMCGSTWSTQATPYLCVGQHRQRHTYVWVNAVNTGIAILVYIYIGATRATPYKHIATQATPFKHMATPQWSEPFFFLCRLPMALTIFMKDVATAKKPCVFLRKSLFCSHVS